MIGEWCYFRSHLTPERCKQIIEDSKIFPEVEGVIGKNVVDPEFRRSKVRFIPNGYSKFKDIFDILWLRAIEANSKYFNIHFTKLDYIQLTEYDFLNAGEYKTHHDIFWMNGDPHYHRKLSCTVQLSDPKDYDGGNLELIDVDEYPNASEIKEQGTILFFPSFISHQVTRVTRGKRYSLVAWFDGPKWR